MKEIPVGERNVYHMNGKTYTIKGQPSKQKWPPNTGWTPPLDVADAFDQFSPEELEDLLQQVLRRTELQCTSEIPEQIDTLVELSPTLAKIGRFFVEDRYWPQGNALSKGKPRQAYQKLRQFERTNKKWVRYHLDQGLPTFFSMLCVEPKVDEERLEDVYGYKRKNSSFPEDVLDEAYRTLKNPKLRTNYLQFLKVFQNYYVDVLDAKYQASLDKDHEILLKIEKNTILHSIILQRHPNWDVLYEIGINLLSAGKVKASDDAQKPMILSRKKNGKQSSEGRIRTLVRQALSDPATLADYRVFVGIIPFLLPPEESNLLVKFQGLWKKCNFSPEEFETLLGDDPVEEMIRKWYSIKRCQSDWARFLPPNSETYYHLLGLPSPLTKSCGNSTSRFVEAGFEESTKIFRDTLFEQFRRAPKTPEINAAYTVLRNPKDKADYDWLLAHNILITRVAALLGSFRMFREDCLKKISKGLVLEEAGGKSLSELNIH